METIRGSQPLLARLRQLAADVPTNVEPIFGLMQFGGLTNGRTQVNPPSRRDQPIDVVVADIEELEREGYIKRSRKGNSREFRLL